MNNILSIDTTSNLASVTVAKIDEKTKNISYNENNDLKTHSEKLFPLIDSSLKTSNLNISNIDTFLVTNGPGSFTGTRIGVTTIKGLTVSNNSNIFAFSSLEIMAYACYSLQNTTNNIVSILDAKGGRIYYGIYEFKESSVNIISKPIADTFDNLITTLNNMNIQFTLCFDNIDYFKEELNTLNFYPYNILITSNNILDYYLYLSKKENYKFNSYDLDVEYIRPSQAERMKNGDKC